jgi:hypothetical protein
LSETSRNATVRTLSSTSNSPFAVAPLLNATGAAGHDSLSFRSNV